MPPPKNKNKQKQTNKTKSNQVFWGTVYFQGAYNGNISHKTINNLRPTFLTEKYFMWVCVWMNNYLLDKAIW